MFRLSCLTDLKDRSLDDIFITCLDGLSGFPEAIRAYPPARVQLCLVHAVRAAMRYASTVNGSAVAADLKKMHQAATEVEASRALEEFDQVWDAKYPTIAKQRRQKRPDRRRFSSFRRRSARRTRSSR